MFLEMPQGGKVMCYTLANTHGCSVGVLDLGGVIVSLRAPDRRGVFEDIVLAYHDPQVYLSNPLYFGGLIGRHANRIAGGQFSINGTTYQLAQNDGSNNLHSGPLGWHLRPWQAEVAETENSASVTLSLHSADGDQGFPGALDTRVTFTLDDHNRLILTYEALCAQDTIVNLTNHTYFNLGGSTCPDILGHHLELQADLFTPIDELFIPTGEILPVSGTPFDLRKEAEIGTILARGGGQMAPAGGLDHNFMLDSESEMRKIAALWEPTSGRMMCVATDMPGVQVYTGNQITTTIPGRGGKPLHRHAGICLETQYPPNAVNQPGFPSPVLKANERYIHHTEYSFTVQQ